MKKTITQTITEYPDGYPKTKACDIYFETRKTWGDQLEKAAKKANNSNEKASESGLFALLKKPIVDTSVQYDTRYENLLAHLTMFSFHDCLMSKLDDSATTENTTRTSNP
jgi:hypothetical protein